ncbi:MAG: hypothetical protein QOE99_1505 [Actinomycetota bacterium]|nr:hypothetical protein [Actinomycetota bacterium]
MAKVSVDARLDVARREASDALDALRGAVLRGRDALAAVADLKDEMKQPPPPKRQSQTQGRGAL